MGAVLPETRDRILELQKRCVECGSVYALHVHHRVFQSEHEIGVHKLLADVKQSYEEGYGKELKVWGLHDIQNLVVLCIECHEGNGVGVHGGNEKLRQKYRMSFTCTVTGFNIPFIHQKRLF